MRLRQISCESPVLAQWHIPKSADTQEHSEASLHTAEQNDDERARRAPPAASAQRARPTPSRVPRSSRLVTRRLARARVVRGRVVAPAAPREKSGLGARARVRGARLAALPICFP